MNECKTETHGDLLLVRVRGEVDLSWSQSIRKSILDALARATKVGVELSEVSYIDSSGIAALVEGFQSARGRGQGFWLVASSQPVKSVLQLARLDRVFPMVDDLAAARG
jgi:anti-sigma B factor antagonist